MKYNIRKLYVYRIIKQLVACNLIYSLIRGLNEMQFQEDDIEAIRIVNSPRNLASLIVGFLCGKSFEYKISTTEKGLMQEFIGHFGNDGIRHRQFNELLLLLNQDIVTEDFFKFFFGDEVKSIDDLKKGIIKFRGIALLCFGNIKFAFRKLSQMDNKQLEATLGYCMTKPEEIKEEFQNRSKELLSIKKIDKDKTWYLGEITGKLVGDEIKETNKIISELKQSGSKPDKIFGDFINRLSIIDSQIQPNQEKGINNTYVYLTWDYMDVYVATSMRNKWEYEDTFDTINSLFEDKKLKTLNLRYFDPTQSFCTNPRDKGLLESLMLKRTSCAIYLAQENDTMGKDSELAIMLAQGKPVIAYVPKYDPERYAEKIAKYPLSFFKRRLNILYAEEIFEKPSCIENLSECECDFSKILDDFSQKLREYFAKQPLTLWTEKDETFKNSYNNFKKVCRIVAVAECLNFDKRAEVLKGRHPLCIQVDLKTGVTNGVLVVRTLDDCISLLSEILTNELKFRIEYVSLATKAKSKEGHIELQEEISKSAFRVITGNEKLTNSFWNLFCRRRNNLYSITT